MKSLHIDLPTIQDIVRTNDKQRFSLIPITELPDHHSHDPSITTIDTTNPSHFLIRANQGHSLAVDNEGLLTSLSLEKREELPSVVVHGTNFVAWSAIVASGGLKPMGRNHVHFATGLPAGFETGHDDGQGLVERSEAPVISGMRKSSTVLIYLDLFKALEDGLKFFVSENGVVLGEGGESGVIGVKYFRLVEQRGRNSGVLMRDGVLVDRSSS